MRRRAFVTLVPAGLLAVACGGSDPVGGGNPPPAPPPPPPPPPPPAAPVPGADVTMRIVDNAFVDPDGEQNADARVDIQAGQTVGWRNDGGTLHTVTSTSIPSGAMAFDSGNISPSDTFSVTLSVAGTYIYRCEVHPNEMRDARIVVT